MFRALWRGIKAINKKVLVTAAFLIAIFAVTSTWIGVSTALAAFKPVSWDGLSSEERQMVSGNGGPAVMVGNWLYFVGNYVETSSIRYRQNEYNKVTYGAIYRVNIDPALGNPLYEDAGRINDHPLGSYTQHLLDKSKYHLVVPKIAGFEEAALWVFDQHLIYTSPNNQRDRRGDLRSSRIDFFRVDLDGRNHRKLYTTSSDMLSTENFTVGNFGGEVFIIVHDGSMLRRISVTEKPGRIVTVSRTVQGKAALPVVVSYRTDEDFEGYTLEASYGGIMGHVFYTEILSEEDRDLKLGGNRIFQYNVFENTSVEAKINEHTIGLLGLSNGRLVYTVNDPDGAELGIFSVKQAISDSWKVPFSQAGFMNSEFALLDKENQVSGDEMYWQTENAPGETFFRYALLRSGTMHLYRSGLQSPVAEVVGVSSIIRICRQYVHYLDGAGNFAAVELHNGAQMDFGIDQGLMPKSETSLRPWVIGRNNTFWHFFIRTYSAECDDDDHDHDHSHHDDMTIAMLADLWSGRQRDFENQFVFILGRLDCKFLNNPESDHEC